MNKSLSSKDPTIGDEFEGFDEREFLRALKDNLPDHVYVKDPEARYVLNNAGHAKDLGAASPEEIAGKPDFDLYPRELAERYRADEQEIFHSGQPLWSTRKSPLWTRKQQEVVLHHQGAPAMQ